MKSVLRNLLFVLVIVTLISCASGAQTMTVAPSSTPVPSVTPTLTSVPTSTATERPKSAVDEIFALPTMGGGVIGATPVPFATPHSDNPLMKLQDLSETDLLQLIAELQERSYQYSPPHGGLFSDSYFADAQMLVALAIQELLFRFPNSVEAERLRWQLAFIGSIMYADLKGNEFYDQWIVEQLQDKLNNGLVLPDNLESVLDRYWFDVSYYEVVDNLFGEQKPAWFYVIAPLAWEEEENKAKSPEYFYRGGLFVVVREITKGRFQIYILENGWSFQHGASSLFEISDFNKNGTTEIALDIGYHSGTMCRGNLKIFEWRGDAFLDLTKGNIGIEDCVDSYGYFLLDGVPSVRLRSFYDGIPAIYKWNGNYYDFSGYEHTNAMEKWRSTQLDSKKSFAEEAVAIEEILSMENRESLSFSQIDFLRFRLGIVYALDSQSLKAREVLQDLAENPMDTSRTIYSNFAKNFLRYYIGDENLYLACEKSRKILDDTNRLSSGSEEEALFGITFDFATPFGPGLLRCFASDVFKLLINKMSVSIENVPDELRKSGLKLYYAKKQDVNLDGLIEEWLMVFDDGVFTVVPDGPHYKTIELEYFWHGEDTSRYSDADINVVRWDGIQDPILTISTDKELSMMSIGEDYSPTQLNFGYEIDDVLFSPNSDPAQVQILYTKPASENNYATGPWGGYRWDSARREFREDLIEYYLFIEHSPEKAVEIANVIMPLLLDWRDLDSVAWALPRYFYLCGLSYELAGDDQSAAKIYWQLWHDFPESQYALMTKYKLETVTP